MAFEDYVWGLALRRNVAPYDPRNTLFSKLEEIQKEKRAEDAVARRDARAFENAQALERIRAASRLAETKEQQERGADLIMKARAEADLVKSVDEIERKNAAREKLYSDADAAVKYIYGEGGEWKVKPNLSPEQNEADAIRAIQRVNTLAYRRLEQQYEDAQKKITEAQQEVAKLATPTPEEIGKALARDIDFFPESLKKDKSGRLKALLDGKFDAALSNLPIEDVSSVQGLISKHEQALAKERLRSNSDAIAALNRQAIALGSKNSTIGARLHKFADRAMTGEPVYMFLDPNELRQTKLPGGTDGGGVGSVPDVAPTTQPVPNIGALRQQDEIAISQMAPSARQSVTSIGAMRAADEQRMNADREMALALGLDIMSNTQRPMTRFDTELGLSDASEVSPAEIPNFLGIPLWGGSTEVPTGPRFTAIGDQVPAGIAGQDIPLAIERITGIPVTSQSPSYQGPRTTALGSPIPSGISGAQMLEALKRIPGASASAIEAAKVRGPQFVERVRQAIGIDPRPDIAVGPAVGINPQQTYTPVMPSTNAFIPMLQYNQTNQVSPADVVREYLKNKYQFSPAPVR